MTNEVKLRLYITAIVIVMAILYVSPSVINSNAASLRSEFSSSCFKATPEMGFDYCWQEATQKAALSTWDYLLPYLFAVIILWFSWLFKLELRLSDNSYPKRTMNALLWLGLLVAAIGIWIPISEVASTDVAKLHKISPRQLFAPSWFAATWLIAPLLFHRLVAPTSLATSMKKGKIALILLLATPIIALALLIVRLIIEFGLDAL